MLFTLVLTLALACSSTAALEAISAGYLPEKRFEIVAVYDNENSIYLLGGKNDTDNGVSEILKFDLETETLVPVGQFPEALNQGSAHLDSEGNIFYFGGEYGFPPTTKTNKIWKIDTHTTNGEVHPEPAGTLPYGIASHCSVYDGHNSFLIQGGYTTTFQEQAYSYDKVRNSSWAFTLSDSTARTSSACVLVQGSTFLWFGGWGSSYENTVVQYDLTQGIKTVIESTFEFGITGSVAVEANDGTVYVVGGGNGDPTVQKHHLSTYDVSSNELTPQTVEGLRTNLYRPGVVFVPKLNRIYVFGGREYGTDTPTGTTTVDEICYIPL